MAVYDANGGGGYHLAEWGNFQRARCDEFVEGEGEGDGGSGDGCGAGTSVGLEDVAVEDDGALAEGLHVDDGAEAAADEALDLVGAAADFAALGLAGGAGEGGAGEHPVLGGDPATAGVAEPAGDALLDGGVTEDAGVAGFDEDGAFGGGDEVGGEADGAEGVGGAVVGAEELCCGLGGSGGGHEEHYSGATGGDCWVLLGYFETRCDVARSSKMGRVPKWEIERNRFLLGICGKRVEDGFQIGNGRGGVGFGVIL